MLAPLRTTESRSAHSNTRCAARRLTLRILGVLGGAVAIVLMWGGTAGAESKPTLLGTVEGLLDGVGETVDQTLTSVDQTLGSVTEAEPAPAPTPDPEPPIGAAPTPSPQPGPAPGLLTQAAQDVVAPVTGSVDLLEPVVATGSPVLHVAGQLDQVTEPLLTSATPVTGTVVELGREVGQELADTILVLAPITHPLDEALRPVTDLTGSLVTALTPVVVALDPTADAITPVPVDLVDQIDRRLPVGPTRLPQPGPAPESGARRAVVPAAVLVGRSFEPTGRGGPTVSEPETDLAGDDRARAAVRDVADPGSPRSEPTTLPAPDGIPFSPGSTTSDRGGDSGAKTFEGVVGAAPTGPRSTAASVVGTHRSNATDGPGRQPGFAPD